MTASRDAWLEPGAHEVAPGVHRIPLPLPQDGLRAVNVYAIRDGERLVLVDGGWTLPASEELLARSLDELGHGLGDIGQFLVTHAHRDHYTQAVAVRRRFGAHVSIGEGEQPSMALLTPDRPAHEIAQVRLLERSGAPALAATVRQLAPPSPDRTDWEPPDQWLSDGAKVRLDERTLEAVHTPGHTRGHLVYHDAAHQILFAGDHVLPHITPSIGFEQAVVPSPLADYLTSLRLVRAMPDALLLPAHGPVTHSVHERVDELLTHHEERLDASLAALRSGADTAYEVAGLLGWTRRHRALADLDPFNQMLAVLETGAHLAVLAERGHLRREERDGVVHYVLP